MRRSSLPHRPRGLVAARVLKVAGFAFLASASMAGCASGNDDAAPADTGAATGAATPGAAASGTEQDNGTVHLEVVGGPHAGTYDARMTSGGCSYGLAGAGSWGNQHSIDSQDPKTFTSLQLIVPDAKAAASGTSAFLMTASFGPLFGAGSTSYDIDTRPNTSKKQGSGTVTVDDKGTTGKVTFDGKTASGIGLKGTIDCRKVIRG